jgi:hypothetical protein
LLAARKDRSRFPSQGEFLKWSDEFEQVKADPEFHDLVLRIEKEMAAEKETTEKIKDHVEKTGGDLQPPPIVESVLLLKAMATLFVSVAVVPLLLLPLYQQGFSWWGEGALLFMDTSFDFPRLGIQFKFAFGVPKFPQIRMRVQLVVGIILVALQLLVRLVKWLLWAYIQEVRASDSEPGAMELSMLSIVSAVSWHPFRLPMEVLQGTLQSKTLAQALTPRLKTFSVKEGDVDIEDHCNSEDASMFNKIVCRGNELVVSRGIYAVCMRSGPWLLNLDFSSSTRLMGISNRAVFLKLTDLLSPGVLGPSHAIFRFHWLR